MGSGIWEEGIALAVSDGSLPRRVMGSGIWEEGIALAVSDGSLPRGVMPMVVLVVIDIAVVMTVSIGIGAWAPRWPARWLSSDPVPLRQLPWESPAYFRRLQVRRWTRILPEMGGTFGGQSKDSLPGHDPEALATYLVEVRRAEWVHWASLASAVVLFAFSPWWLALPFLLVVTAGNVPFLIVLRNNRFRIQRIIDHESRHS